MLVASVMDKPAVLDLSLKVKATLVGVTLDVSGLISHFPNSFRYALKTVSMEFIYVVVQGK